MATLAGMLLFAGEARAEEATENPTVWRATNPVVWTASTSTKLWSPDWISPEGIWKRATEANECSSRAVPSNAHVPAATIDWKAIRPAPLTDERSRPYHGWFRFLQGLDWVTHVASTTEIVEPLDVFPRELIPEVAPTILSPTQVQRDPRLLPIPTTRNSRQPK